MAVHGVDVAQPEESDPAGSDPAGSRLEESQLDEPDSVGSFVGDPYCLGRVAEDLRLSGRVQAAHRAMTVAFGSILETIEAVVASDSFVAQGAPSPVEWLVANLKVHPKTARLWCRMAKQLQELPETRRRVMLGELGFDQLRQVLKYVEPETEADILAVAVDESAADLEEAARTVRTVSRERVERVRSERWFEGFFDHDDMVYSFRGEIPGYDGLTVSKAIDLLAWNAADDETSMFPRPPEHRAADALVEMASNALANQSNHDIATTVIHVQAEHLTTEDRVGLAEFGTDVPVAVIRRLTCDGRLQLVAHGDDGCVVGVGRITRSVPYWLQRLIRQRDAGCRFPGCRRTYWTQIHHMVHWAHGGPTDIDNLVTLCGHHHRRLHDDGWKVSGDPSGQLDWRLPGGHPLLYPVGKRSWETFRDLDLEAISSWVQHEADRQKPSPG